ncbi:hypothetical protein NC652_038670 [Populus alba x Populus x berolinensis]|nr:hypothetical protein NC652_038670 [Populus alba x Populus x berolinensis]
MCSCTKDTSNAPNPGTEETYTTCIERRTGCMHKVCSAHMLVWVQKAPFMVPTKRARSKSMHTIQTILTFELTLFRTSINVITRRLCF